MKDDIIDLISDGEDSCCEETEDKKPHSSTKDQRKEPTSTSTSRHCPKETSVKEIVKSQDGNTSHNAENTTRFLSSQPDRSASQGKQITRQFWKAGDYEVKSSTAAILPNGMDHVRVHPKFLHSNATSHKWALGAIAELLDNAIDEVSSGATFVSVDKVLNELDNTPILLVQDDGGGMDPDSMRHCMSLGYSRKTSNMTIGQYGNGFKTSTMRLGADVIVFSRCLRESSTTQSVGMLSYTFLRATGHEDIVVPMIDFELVEGKPKMLVRSTVDDWLNNLSTILQWSPYATEVDLMKQFDNIGQHGTKINVYNLWMNDDGNLELDFDTDKQDIQVRGTSKLDKNDTLQRQLTNKHIANRLRFSLRAYASILYLKMPENFEIRLRGKVVEHVSIADDLKFAERILYKPQIGTSKDFAYKEVSVITTIGFAKEAPMINVHGFNVYHKNRLIMPFWKVFQENSSRGRGVVGVLEANFMEPAHDKQDFERTPILQRLETRLKQMSIEYWNLHCNFIGYQVPKQCNKPRTLSSPSLGSENPGLSRLEANGDANTHNEGVGKQGETSAPSTPPQPGTNGATGQTEQLNVEERTCTGIGSDKTSGSTSNHLSKKRAADSMDQSESLKRQKITSTDKQSIVIARDDNSIMNLDDILDENQKLRARCQDFEAREDALKSKVSELEAELQRWKTKCRSLLGRSDRSEVRGPLKSVVMIPKEEYQ